VNSITPKNCDIIANHCEKWGTWNVGRRFWFLKMVGYQPPRIIPRWKQSRRTWVANSAIVLGHSRQIQKSSHPIRTHPFHFSSSNNLGPDKYRVTQNPGQARNMRLTCKLINKVNKGWKVTPQRSYQTLTFPYGWIHGYYWPICTSRGVRVAISRITFLSLSPEGRCSGRFGGGVGNAGS